MTAKMAVEFLERVTVCTNSRNSKFQEKRVPSNEFSVDRERVSTSRKMRFVKKKKEKKLVIRCATRYVIYRSHARFTAARTLWRGDEIVADS